MSEKEYIERDAVYEMLENAQMISDGEYCGYCTEDVTISSIPAADVAPVVHGRWLPCGFGKEIMCSVCRCELDDVWKYRHCPDCGAKMDLDS